MKKLDLMNYIKLDKELYEKKNLDLDAVIIDFSEKYYTNYDNLSFSGENTFKCMLHYMETYHKKPGSFVQLLIFNAQDLIYKNEYEEVLKHLKNR